MTGDEAVYLTPAQAAQRLGKSPSQVRRDAQAHRINSIRRGGRILILDDERLRALEEDPSLQFPTDVDVPSGESPAATSPDVVNGLSGSSMVHELIDEVADLRSEVARLTARLRKLEAGNERSRR